MIVMDGIEFWNQFVQAGMKCKMILLELIYGK